MNARALLARALCLRAPALFLLAPLTMAACGGSETSVQPIPTIDLPIPPGQPDKPSGTPEAQRFFVEGVYPLLTNVQKNSEACSNCHSTGLVGAPAFLAGSAQTAYKVIRDYNGGALAAIPENNLLLTKSQHEGPNLDGAQRGAVTEWLALEYPKLPPPAGIKTVFNALSSFANCMNRTQFLQSDIADIPLTTLADNAAVNCTLCHSAAQIAVNPQNGGSFVLDADPNLMFDGLKKFPGLLKMVTPVPSITGAFNKLEESFRIEKHGEEPNLVSENGACASANALDDLNADGQINVFRADYCHPNYEIPDAVQKQLQLFVGDTIARAKGGVCSIDTNPGGQ